MKDPKIPLGIGIGIGITSIWALVELWPVLLLGGAAYLVVKGLEEDHTEKQEKSECNTGPQKK